MPKLSREQLAAIVPYYDDEELTSAQRALLVARLLHTLGDLGRHQPVLVVDSALTLLGNVDIGGVVSTIHLLQSGKAEAVRFGQAELLRRYPDRDFFTQSDFDGDTWTPQARQMADFLRKKGITGDTPAMVLGGRYNFFERKKYVDAHRATIFQLQRNFCRLLGFPEISDPTTGLRVYTRSLVESFVRMGIAPGFASDVEELIIARLVGALVFEMDLIRARKRGDHTNLHKFAESRAAVYAHAQELTAVGLQEVVDVFGNPDLIKALHLVGLRLDDRNGEQLRGVGAG